MQKKNKKFLNLPTYPGGSKAMKEFIHQHLRYPEEALKNNIQGSVFVHYEVDDYGKVVAAEVKKGLGYGCDEEALRLVYLLEYKKVKNIGQRVKVNMKINIVFRLPQNTQLNTAIQYSYTEKVKPKPEADKPSINKEVYTYTIRVENPLKK